jgi:hypothetical protein
LPIHDNGDEFMRTQSNPDSSQLDTGGLTDRSFTESPELPVKRSTATLRIKLKMAMKYSLHATRFRDGIKSWQVTRIICTNA